MYKIALYRKYRPEDFEQTIGQDHVVRVLRNAVICAKVSHAYLFSGPRGTGKTSVARILAKAINCLNKKDGNPCGKCAICKGITEGRIMDLIEIDAASNRGIDEIRDLREKVKFSPTEGSYKVFIIDEVHMLTKEAFNALLKTLEEPPSHAIFILATTELNKVPATIISRCQRHDFRRIKLNDIVSRLAFIAKEEKIKISDEALELVGEASEGGLRDAISLLDQLASLGIREINALEVESVLGIAPQKVVFSFLESILTRNTRKSLEILRSTQNSGIDLVVLTRSLVEQINKLITAKFSSVDNIEGTKEQINALKQMAERFETERILSVSNDLIWIQESFKSNIDPQLILTMLAAKNNNIEESEEEQRTTVKFKPISKANKQDSKPTSFELNSKWKHVLLEIKAKNNTIHAFMRVASPQFSEDELILIFPYKFHKERLEEAKNKRFVEDVLKKVYNREIRVSCLLEGNGHSNNKIEDVESAASILGGEVVD